MEIKTNISLKDYCTFKIGGKAKYLIIASNRQELINAVKLCKEKSIKYKVIGLGANLLFDDLGYNGAIIVNRSNKIRFYKNSVFMDSGVNVSNLISKCIKKNLSGIEKLIGIPSTVGGAIVNGMGAFDVNFFDYVDYVEVLDNNLLNILKLKKEHCKFGYRTSVFKTDKRIIVGAKLNLNTNYCQIKQNMLEALSKKIASQPLNQASAGSVFKRTDVVPAKIIDELGLKGKKINDACISNKHAGFIVNLGSATSKDVKELIQFIGCYVNKTHNILLEKEIEYVDF